MFVADFVNILAQLLSSSIYRVQGKKQIKDWLATALAFPSTYVITQQQMNHSTRNLIILFPELSSCSSSKHKNNFHLITQQSYDINNCYRYKLASVIGSNCETFSMELIKWMFESWCLVAIKCESLLSS